MDIQQFISNHHSLLKNNSKATKSIVKLEDSEDKTLLLIENRNRYIHIAGMQSYAQVRLCCRRANKNSLYWRSGNAPNPT